MWNISGLLVGSYQNLKHNLGDQTELYKYFKSMKDDLKISKLEYLRNRWADLTQILNLNLGDLTKNSE